MSEPPRRPGTPLAGRVPNPPHSLVGRGPERSRLREHLTRARLAVLWGAPGLGKSTLAVALVHDALGGDVERAAHVPLGLLDRLEPVELHVARRLHVPARHGRLDWRELVSAPDQLVTLALDLAEEQAAWVVIDDAHLCAAPELDGLLDAIARWARRSRWVVTCRRPPGGEAARDCAFEVLGLAAHELRELAGKIAPSSTAAQRAAWAEAAAGSPLRLRGLAHGRGADAAGAPAQHASSVERALLARLLAVHVALPEELVGPSDVVSGLEARGLVRRLDGRVVLHDVTRDEPLSPLLEAPERDALLERLLARDEPDLVLAGLGLALDARDYERAAAALDAATPRLIDAGHALALWRALAHHDVEALEPARLESAVALGDGKTLALLAPPRQSASRVRLIWARALELRGASGQALAEIERILPSLDGDERAQAALVAARAHAHENRPELALELVSASRSQRSTIEAERWALLAAVQALLGAERAALAAALAARSLLAELGEGQRLRVAYALAQAYYMLGHWEDARRSLAAGLGSELGSSVRLESGRRLRYLSGIIALDTGHLELTRAELTAIEPWVTPETALGQYRLLALGHLALAVGDVDELHRAQQELACSPRSAQLDAEYRSLLTRGEIFERSYEAAARERDRSTLITGEIARVFEFERALRAGACEPAELLAELGAAAGSPSEVVCLVHQARALAHLALGDANAAEHEVLQGLASAERRGFALRVADALELGCDVARVAGDVRNLAARARDLAGLAAVLPSPRAAEHAAFARAMAESRPSWAELERLASEVASCPAVTERARALLAGSTPADRVDATLVRHLREVMLWAPPSTLAPGPHWTPAWGLERATRRVWLADGRWLDFAAHPVAWEVLRVIAEAGGTATKEQIVTLAWGERSYHPLRHDNRLQAAVRKIRVRLEPDPAAPRRLATHADGYAFGGPVRLA